MNGIKNNVSKFIAGLFVLIFSIFVLNTSNVDLNKRTKKKDEEHENLFI